jgi:hypothetical protein
MTAVVIRRKGGGAGRTGEAEAVGCPHCDGSLTLHQPDVRRPERLLGVCDACKAWVLVGADRRVRLLIQWPVWPRA